MTTTSRTGRRHGRCAARSGPTFPTPAICCWCAPAQEPDEDFLRTLAYSLRRAIQLDYQIEEQDIQVDLIGSEKKRRIILWEAADLFLQPDFHYQRGAIPGVCVFIDG